MTSTSKAPGHNVMGLPHNMAETKPRRVYILHPEAVNEGSIELLEFKDARGFNFSENTAMPHRGISRLRFQVNDLEVFLKSARKSGYAPKAQANNVILSKTGLVNVAVLQAPGGSMIEFYELVK